MRIGVNPAKSDSSKNKLKRHRVIIPVHIPNLTEPYFQNALDVLKICLKSLYDSINHNLTDVSIISDGSCKLVIDYLSELNWPDRLIIHQSNKGKVASVMLETRSVYEDYITISDADVYFYKGWVAATASIFKTYKKAGAVSPLPMMIQGLKQTASVFWGEWLTGNIKYGPVVAPYDCKLFLKGLNNTSLFNRSSGRHPWNEKQYYLDGNYQAVIGAGHFVATYKRYLLLSNDSFPIEKFKKGYELNFLDEPIDNQGFYRLSTVHTYVYHLGNTLDNNYTSHRLTTDSVNQELPPIKQINNWCPFTIKKLYFKVLCKFKNL